MQICNSSCLSCQEVADVPPRGGNWNEEQSPVNSDVAIVVNEEGAQTVESEVDPKVFVIASNDAPQFADEKASGTGQTNLGGNLLQLSSAMPVQADSKIEPAPEAAVGQPEAAKDEVAKSEHVEVEVPSQKPLADGLPNDDHTVGGSSLDASSRVDSLPIGSKVFVGYSFFTWFFIVFFVDVIVVLIGLMLWSGIGAGVQVMVLLNSLFWMRAPLGFLATIILVVLYLLDFYSPPHLPGQRFALGPEGGCVNSVGRGIFAFCMLLMLVAICFSVQYYPHIPPLLTAFCAPVLVGLLRSKLMPREKATKAAPQAVLKDTIHAVVAIGHKVDGSPGSASHSSRGSHDSQLMQDVLQGTAGHGRSSIKRESITASKFLNNVDTFHKQGNVENHQFHKVDASVVRQKLDFRHGCQEDARRFYGSSALAFTVCGWVTAFIWLGWWLGGGNRWSDETRGRMWDDGINTDNFSESYTDDVMYIIWVSPMITAFAHGLFGMMLLLRYRLHDTYVKTDHFEPAVRQALQVMKGQVVKEFYDVLEEAKALNHQIASVMRLFVSVAIGLAGCIWIASEVNGADVNAGRTVKGFVGFFLIAIVLFLTHSFQRWWHQMGSLIKASPMYKSMISMLSSDWAKACLVWMVSPFWWAVLLLSYANQKVRICRGLVDPQDCRHKEVTPTAMEKSGTGKPISEDEEADMGASIDISPDLQAKAPTSLTARVGGTYARIKLWDWTSVWVKVHWLGVIFFILNVGSSKLLNIFLSWLNSLLKDFPIGALIGVWYVVGIGCFLLPPVPGPPVYLFGGLLYANSSLGFVKGTIVCTSLSWVLKLNACAMQQKMIGERLGESKWVLATCGVNRPTMKAIEMVLKEPGLSVGKCCILCGGPDWPTSVTCGLLRVPLHQAILGTTPIIFFVFPCVCTGSFYVQEGDIWRTMASLMLTVSTAVSMVLLVAATFAIQEKMDRYSAHLNRPLRHHVDLDWMDFVSQRCSEVAKAQLVWTDLSGSVRNWLRASSLAMLAGCHIFYWFDAACFGEFTVQTPISKLKFSGEDSFIIMPLGHLGLTLFFGSCFSLFFFGKYSKKRAKIPVANLKKSLDAQESEWKEKRLKEADEAEEELQKEPELLPAECRRGDAANPGGAGTGSDA